MAVDSKSGWHEGWLPLDAPLAAAAAYLAQCHANGAFDRNGLWLLIPDQMMVAQLLGELRARLPETVLRHWQFYTLPALAATVPLPAVRLPAARREALLHAALKPHGWFDERSLWTVTGELSDLFDALTLANSPLPDTLDALIEGLRAAYDLRPVQGLCFEAALVMNAWQALVTQADEGLDPVAAYCLALGRLAASPGPALVSIGLTALAPVEAAFLRNAARLRPVHMLYPDCRGARTDAGMARVLVAAWPEAAAAASLSMDNDPSPPAGLRSRADALRQAMSVSPLAGRLSCYAAATLEAHAAGVAAEIRRWRAAGCRHIAVLVHDRAAARRLQALLTRDGISTADEMGWTLTTTASAAATGALLEAAQARGDVVRLRRLLLSPHLWGDAAPDDAARLRAQLGQAQAGWGGHADPAALADMARRDGLEMLAGALERAVAALDCLAGGARRRVDWLRALHDAFALLGLDAGLLRDPAGTRLLELLAEMEAVLDWDDSLHELTDFGRWLHHVFENSKFRDETLDGEVLFTHAEAARLRQFDAVVVFGADADRLPALPPSGQVLAEQVRIWLGLPGRARQFAAQAAALLQTLSPAGRVLFSWQEQRKDGSLLPSPWVARLDALHECAWGTPLERITPAPAPIHLLPVPTSPPAPLPPVALLPASLSIRALRALRTCPYQFYVRHVLGLGPLADADAPAGRREFGQTVHRILDRFSHQCPQLTGLPPGQAEDALRRLAQMELATLAADDPCQDWQQRFDAMAGPFLDWARAREAAGWRIVPGSMRLARWLPLPAGRGLQIYAHVDRVERRADDPAAIALTDYRVGSLRALRAADPAGDTLPLLGWLAEVPAVETISLNFDDARMTEVRHEAAAGDPDPLTAQLAELAGPFVAGAPFAASGAPEDCRRCEVRGLCRHDHWRAGQREDSHD